MKPAEVAVTEREAEVMGLEGVGWGLVLEVPPPDEPEEEDPVDEPQPGRREEAATASAP